MDIKIPSSYKLETDAYGNKRSVPSPSPFELIEQIKNHIFECHDFSGLFVSNDPSCLSRGIICTCGTQWVISESYLGCNHGEGFTMLKQFLIAIEDGAFTGRNSVLMKAINSKRKDSNSKRKDRQLKHPIFSLEVD
jgi:hypothetical protein